METRKIMLVITTKEHTVLRLKDRVGQDGAYLLAAAAAAQKRDAHLERY